MWPVFIRATSMPASAIRLNTSRSCEDGPMVQIIFVFMLLKPQVSLMPSPLPPARAPPSRRGQGTPGSRPAAPLLPPSRRSAGRTPSTSGAAPARGSPQVARQVDDREEQVAQLVLHALLCALVAHLTQLRYLFVELLENTVRVRPVEALAGGMVLHLDRRHHRRQARRHRDGRFLAFLLPLYALPVDRYLLGGVSLHRSEDVGVSALELLGDSFYDLCEVEPAALSRDLRLEDDLQQQVSQLFARVSPVPGVDGVNGLVGFLEDVV